MPNFVVSTGFSAVDKGLTSFFKKAGVDVNKFGDTSKRSFDKASRSSSRFGDIVKANLTSFSLIKAPSLIASGFSKIVNEASKIEDAVAAFTPLVGGADKANKLVEKLNQTAASTPFQFDNITKSANQLLPVMNGDLEKTVSTFRMLGDTAGGNAQKLDSITRGFTKAMLKGKVDMESLNMIGEAGVPIFTELASSMGTKVNAGFFKMISAGKVTTKDLTKAFQKMTSEGGIFFKGMEISSKTFTGRVSTMKDNIALAAAGIGTALLPIMKQLVDKAILVSQQIRNWVAANKVLIQSKLAGFVEAVKNTMAVLWPLFKGLAKTLLFLAPIFPVIVAGLVAYNVAIKVQLAFNFISHMFTLAKALQAAGGAQAVLNAIMTANPIGLIIVGIAALIAIVILLAKNWDVVSAFLGEKLNKLKNDFMNFIFLIADLWLTTWGNVFKFILQGIAKIGGALGFDVGGLESLVKKISDTQASIRSKSIIGELTSDGTEAPNKEEARAQNIKFQGDLNISGAPAGSTSRAKTTGAPPVRLNLLGQN